MELTLTTRWIEHKQFEQKKELEHGMAIEYYGNSKVRSSGAKRVAFFVLKYLMYIYRKIKRTSNEETVNPIRLTD